MPVEGYSNVEKSQHTDRRRRPRTLDTTKGNVWNRGGGAKIDLCRYTLRSTPSAMGVSNGTNDILRLMLVELGLGDAHRLCKILVVQPRVEDRVAVLRQIRRFDLAGA